MCAGACFSGAVPGGELMPQTSDTRLPSCMLKVKESSCKYLHEPVGQVWFIIIETCVILSPQTPFNYRKCGELLKTYSAPGAVPLAAIRFFTSFNCFLLRLNRNQSFGPQFEQEVRARVWGGCALSLKTIHTRREGNYELFIVSSLKSVRHEALYPLWMRVIRQRRCSPFNI